MRLLQLISWPYLRRHLLRTALTVAGIVLGVSVFVAMHTANQSVLAAFSQTIDRIAGRTELQVTAGETGFGEDVLEIVQSAETVGVAVPVIEAVVESDLPGQGTLLVLGVDMTGDRSLREYDLEGSDEEIIDDPLIFLAQPDSLIVSRELADRHDLAIGSTLPLRTAGGAQPFTVRGIMQPAGLATAFGGNLAVMDVYAAQKMFGRGRTFDRIDLAVAPEATVAGCQEALTARLGPGFDVQPPAARGRQAETMLAGYTVMVSISSAFALFIGMFIIYNSFAIAVTQRRSEIGILRALGATEGQVRRLFLAESAVLGAIGSIAGLGLGIVLARAIAGTMGALASDLYGVARQAGDVATQPVVLALAFGAGVATSLVAAVVPARDASRVDPVQALQKGRHQGYSAEASRARVLLATAAGVLSMACLAATELRPLFYAGYALAIAAAVLLAPLLSSALARALRPLLGALRPVEGALAADSLIQAPRRTSATVLALMLSLALVIAFGGMARASYGSVVEWMDTSLNPDLFVMPSPRLDLRTSRFPATMAEEIGAVPGVARVQRFRNGRINLGGVPVMAVAVEMESVAETARTKPVAGRAPEMYQRAGAGEGFIISDSLSERLRLRLGDALEIAAPHGTIRLPVVGIIVDYTDQQGAVFMDRRVFVRYWQDDSVSDFRVYVEPGAGIAAVRQRILDRYAGKRQVFVLTSDESRSYVLRITDQWFGLMNVQVAVAVLVAILGIVNTLTVSIADRRRELGVLQAVGALRGQVRRTIWLEALAVAVLGLVLGCVLGAVNLYYVLDIVQRDVAGLRLDYQYPVATALVLVPAILGAAFAAAILPAESAVRASLVEALEYE
jgi:putative ABC transport system permease protein